MPTKVFGRQLSPILFHTIGDNPVLYLLEKLFHCQILQDAVVLNVEPFINSAGDLRFGHVASILLALLIALICYE
ncbi:hypothetical protein D3C86_1904790 [compost metagenome]